MIDCQREQRKAAKIAAAVLDGITPFMRPDMTGLDIDAIAHEIISELGGIVTGKDNEINNTASSSISVSINRCSAHGLPDHTPFKSGDLVSIDVTVGIRDIRNTIWIASAAKTYGIGSLTNYKRDLIRHNNGAVKAAIQTIRAGISIKSVSEAIESYLMSHGYSPVDAYLALSRWYGYRSGTYISVESNKAPTTLLKAGDVVIVESLAVKGKDTDVSIHSSGVYTNSLSAQTKHTIMVTGPGNDVLTWMPSIHDGLSAVRSLDISIGADEWAAPRVPVDMSTLTLIDRHKIS